LKYFGLAREDSEVAKGPDRPPPREAGEDRFLPTRVTLLSRLRDWEDRASWQDFFDTYWRLIYGTARRAGLAEEEAHDVVQEVLVGASKALPGFQYDPAIGTFKSWLMRITRRKIADQFNKRPPWQAAGSVALRDTDTGRVPVTPEDLPGSDEAAIDQYFEAEWKQNLVAAAMRRVRGKVTHRQFQIFDLYVGQDRSVPEVCAALKVSRGQVYLARHRVAKKLREEVARLEEEAGEPPRS
jgi:RNA polymerase sigma-70 factor (ECF subfamily)